MAPPKKLPPPTRARSDESEYSGTQQPSGDEDSVSGDSNEDVTTKPRRPRTATRWPADKISVTEIDENGFPMEEKAQRRMRRLAGLVARQQLPLVLDSVKSLSNEERDFLFDRYCLPKLEFPEGMRAFAKKYFFRLVAKSFRSYKSHLVSNYVVKGLTPFARQKHIKPRQWADFVRLKTTPEFKEQSEYYKLLRERNVFDHHLGTAGYQGKYAQWEAEDAMLAKAKIANPWDLYPDCRSRFFLRARSTLLVTEGKAEIQFVDDGSKHLAKAIKHKHIVFQGSDVNFVREHDILSSCLGKEHPGRVRGFSCYKGWKHGFPECTDMYRKRKRAHVDIEAMKAELRDELMDELVNKIRLLHGETIFETGDIPSTVAGRKMISPSAPDHHCSASVLLDEAADPIAHVDAPTACALLIHHPGTQQIEVARGQLHPRPGDVEILAGYAVVKVEYVHYPFRGHLLDTPPNFEITKLGQSVNRRIQWRRTDILLNPEPMDCSVHLNNASRTEMDPEAHHVSMNLGMSHAPVSSHVIGTKEVSSVPEQEQDIEMNGACKMATSAATKEEVPFVESELDKQKKVSKPHGRSKVGGAQQMNKQNVSTTYTKTGRPHRNVSSRYATLGSPTVVDNRRAGKGKKKRQSSSGMTNANPNYNFGSAMLKVNDLSSCGPSARRLHAYYIEACGEQKVDIILKFDGSDLCHGVEGSDITVEVGFSDLYDLFNIDSMDMGLLRCFSIYMAQKVKEDGLPVGIMDPQMFSKDYIKAQESSVVEYIKNVFDHFSAFSNSIIMFAHNIGDHWILVLIIPRWNKVLYLDSIRSKQRDHELLKSVINQAYGLSNYKNKRVLIHATKFACHRQPKDRSCGFYTAHHMTLAVAAATCADPEDFEVPSTELAKGVLSQIREVIAEFLMLQLGK